MDSFIGEIAALLAAFGFSITSVCYTFAGRKVSAVTSAALSLPISWIIIAGIHQFTFGQLLPRNASIDRWFFLGASGILAFAISSYFMLNAFQSIGPRLTMLVASFAPVLGAILAWVFLGQTLPPDSMIGILVVIFGIIWVVMERSKTSAAVSEEDLRRGVTLASLGTLAQAAAFVFASRGVSDGFPPLSATLIRLSAGMIALWVFVALQKNTRATLATFRDDLRLFLQLTGAAITGPVIAGWLLLLSFQFIPVGVSTTLSHTTSIMLIPISYFVFGERISLRAIIGTVVTIIGIAILFS